MVICCQLHTSRKLFECYKLSKIFYGVFTLKTKTICT